jgi:hypothetical protein
MIKNPQKFELEFHFKFQSLEICNYDQYLSNDGDNNCNSLHSLVLPGLYRILPLCYNSLINISDDASRNYYVGHELEWNKSVTMFKRRDEIEAFITCLLSQLGSISFLDAIHNPVKNLTSLVSSTLDDERVCMTDNLTMPAKCANFEMSPKQKVYNIYVYILRVFKIWMYTLYIFYIFLVFNL